MQIPVQTFLRLVEQAGTLACWDIEATGLKGDYNSILCVSIKPFGKDPITFAVEKPGNDRKVVEAAAKELGRYDCWVSYYGKGFDYPMLNTRLLRWGLPRLHAKPHIDLYYGLKYHTLLARRSQAHILAWLQLEDPQGTITIQKMTVGADEWNRVLSSPKQVMPTMVKRCESDVKGLEAIYRRTHHLLNDVRP
jgi:uncharacterized protein YprB with RNaseH-like and TPR domain